VAIVRGYRAATQGGGGGGPGGGPGGMMLTGPMSRAPLPSMAGQAAAAAAAAAQAAAASATDAAAMLPDNLALLPLYSMALQKCTLYRGGELVRSDERAALVYRMLTMPTVSSRPYVYPRLMSLHDMEEGAGRPDPARAGEELNPAGVPGLESGPAVALPGAHNLSAERLTPGGVFLLDDGVETYVWVGRAAPAGLLQALFGVPSLDGLNPAALTLAEQPNDFSARVHAILRTLRAAAPAAQRVRVVREGAGDLGEARFHWHMIEDRQNFQGGTVAYGEYLAIVNKESQMAALGGVGGGAAGGSN
jgi:protein transport protein SEC24